jgi:hypothetical protein
MASALFTSCACAASGSTSPDKPNTATAAIAKIDLENRMARNLRDRSLAKPNDKLRP